MLSIGASTFGTGFAPGSKMQYQNEYLFGMEHQIKNGMVLSARFIYRYIPRALDDVAGISPEAYVNNPNMTQLLLHCQSWPRNRPVSPTSMKPATPRVTAAACGLHRCCNRRGQRLCRGPDSGRQRRAHQSRQTGGPWNNGNGICWQKVNGYWGGEQGPQGQPVPDGVSDGFPRISHIYRAVEVEANKSFPITGCCALTGVWLT